VDLKEIRRESVTRIQMAQYSVQRRTHVTQYANELWGCIKGEAFTDSLSDYKLLENSAPLNTTVRMRAAWVAK
jgi:hypothetical protein